MWSTWSLPCRFERTDKRTVAMREAMLPFKLSPLLLKG